VKEQLNSLKLQISSMAFFRSPFFLKYNRLIIPGTVLVLALFIIVLVTIPQFLKLFATFRTIEELNTKKLFYQKKISELQSLDLALYRKELETALVALPVDKDITGVTGELLVALSESGMSLENINFSSAAAESEKVQEYTLNLDVSGSEDNLKNFLDRVELSPRIIRLSTINVTRSKNNTINAAIGFATLYQQLPQNIGSVDENVPQITPEDLKTLADIENKIKSLPRVSLQQASSSAVGKLDPFSN
jgi:Tfp pilus assembly protein PilO